MAVTLLRALLATLLLLPRAGQAAETERWTALADTSFSHYTGDQGLPQALVSAIAEDGDGFLWAGTQGGLARWDGYRFRTYKSNPGDQTTLPDNWITKLYADRQGRLWIGTASDGLARYERTEDAFVRAAPLSNPHVTAIEGDGAAGLWIGTDNGLDRLDTESGTVTPWHHDAGRPGSLPDDRILALLRDRRGTLWIGSRAGLARRDPGSDDFVAVPLAGAGGKPIPVRSLFESGDGRLWIGTEGLGLETLDPASGQARLMEDASSTAIPLRTQAIDFIVAAKSGELWLAFHGEGIVALDPATGRFRRIRHDQRLPGSLGHDLVRSMFRDRSGSLWIGTTHWLDRQIDGQGAITTVFASANPEGGLSGADVLSVLAAPDGKIWLGFGQPGLDIVDPVTGRVDKLLSDPAAPETSLPRDTTFAMTATESDVFIGTARGVYRSDLTGKHLHRLAVQERDPAAPTAMVSVLEGNLWIGGREDGLWTVPLTGIAPPMPDNAKLADQRVTSMVSGPEGVRWIGTLSGLVRFDPRADRVERLPTDSSDPSALMPGFVSSLAVDRQGRLWVGLLGGGICVLTGRGGDGKRHFHRLGTADGLPSANIDKMLLDSSGRMWVSMATGLAVVDPHDFSVRPLRRADGLAVEQYWSGAGTATPEGELVFGGSGGITVVRPDRLASWDYLPPVVPTDIRVGGKQVPAGPYFGTGAPVAPLRIQPEANSLAVEFAALDYSAPELNRYAYRLDGYDRDWIPADSTRRLAAYTNLPPGHYTLRLRGSNRNGAFSETSLDLPILVMPAWYQTYWFYALLAAAALAATLAIVQYRTAYLRRRQRDLERQVAERTAVVVEKSTQIASLLDNSGEGFLSFGADLVVDPDHSRACETLLGQAPAGRDAALLLFPDDPKNAELLRRTVSKVLETSDPLRREVMLSLLPRDFACTGFDLEARYRVLEGGHVMVVLRDITEERRLTRKVARERQRLELIVAAVSDGRDFFDAIDAFRAFAQRGLPDLLASAAKPAATVHELYRQIHTFKGLLAQFSCEAVPEALQALEDRLAALSDLGEDVTRGQLAEAAGSVAYEDLLDRDLAPLRKALGEAFLERGRSIALSAEQARLLSELADRMRRGEAVDLDESKLRHLLDGIATLTQVSLHDILAGFDRTIQQVAARLGKEVAPLAIDAAGEVWLDPEIYGPFCRSLVHVFRNAVVHGIEDPEERLEAEKSEAGTISCRIEVEGDTISLIIADDGAGVDLAALRRHAVETGTLSPQESEAATDRAILDLIFADSISTAAIATELAGRGVGLAAVRQETTALGGTVTLSTTAGEGTRFLFRLPLAAARREPRAA